MARASKVVGGKSRQQLRDEERVMSRLILGAVLAWLMVVSVMASGVNAAPPSTTSTGSTNAMVPPTSLGFYPIAVPSTYWSYGWDPVWRVPYMTYPVQDTTSYPVYSAYSAYPTSPITYGSTASHSTSASTYSSKRVSYPSYYYTPEGVETASSYHSSFWPNPNRPGVKK